jgi:hypothetical protein
MLDQDQVSALRRVRLVRVYVSKDTFANAKCWAHGRRGNLEGSEGEICLHIENDDGSRKRDCQNGISGPRYRDRWLGRLAGCRSVYSVGNDKESPRYGEQEQKGEGPKSKREAGFEEQHVKDVEG